MVSRTLVVIKTNGELISTLKMNYALCRDKTALMIAVIVDQNFKTAAGIGL